MRQHAWLIFWVVFLALYAGNLVWMAFSPEGATGPRYATVAFVVVGAFGAWRQARQ